MIIILQRAPTLSYLSLAWSEGGPVSFCSCLAGSVRVGSGRVGLAWFSRFTDRDKKRRKVEELKFLFEFPLLSLSRSVIL